MRKILRQYIFTLGFLLCLAFMVGGIITVREKTRYNMDMSPYSTVIISENSEGLKITVGEKETFIKREHMEDFGKKVFYGALGDVFVRVGNILEKNAR